MLDFPGFRLPQGLGESLRAEKPIKLAGFWLPQGCEEGSPEVRDKLREEFAAYMHSQVTDNYKTLATEMEPWLKAK